jgi:hypothetical protein
MSAPDGQEVARRIDDGGQVGEGLQTMDEDDDMLSAMARELVEKNGIGETADNVWRALTREHQKQFPQSRAVADCSQPAVTPPFNLLSKIVFPDLADATLESPILAFGAPIGTAKTKRRPRASNPDQGCLFGVAIVIPEFR